jgi:hypothetical protein
VTRARRRRAGTDTLGTGSRSSTGGVTRMRRSAMVRARARRRTIMSSSDDPEDIEIHPMYEVAAHLEELYSVPLYRRPEEPLIERWREIGERLLALGLRHLEEGVEAADVFVQAKLEERRQRRRRRRAKRRATAAAAAAPAAPAAPAAASAPAAPAAQGTC